jgi:hypothetical protein
VARWCAASRAVAEAELHRRAGRRLSPRETEARLAEGLRRLNALLTRDRATRRASYLSDPPLMLAYLCHHFPVHAAKVAILCRENLATPPARPWRVLDVGAGPLSACAGALAAFPGPALVHAVDLSGTMMRLGLRVLEALCPDAQVTLEVATAQAVAARTPPAAGVDLLVMANVLGELGGSGHDDHERLSVCQGLLRAAPRHVLLLEPGTRIHAQALVRVRERILAWGDGGDGWTVAAPCVGQPACPMLRGPHWCHADREITWPDAYLRLARAAGLQPESLRFSSLWLTRDPVPPHPPGTLRLVGGPMDPGDGRLLRYACGPQGRVTLAGRGGHAAEAWARAPRGALTRVSRETTVVEGDTAPRAPSPRGHQATRRGAGVRRGRTRRS